jgi:hypothetical protein
MPGPVIMEDCLRISRFCLRGQLISMIAEHRRPSVCLLRGSVDQEIRTRDSAVTTFRKAAILRHPGGNTPRSPRRISGRPRSSPEHAPILRDHLTYPGRS